VVAAASPSKGGILTVERPHQVAQPRHGRLGCILGAGASQTGEPVAFIRGVRIIRHPPERGRKRRRRHGLAAEDPKQRGGLLRRGLLRITRSESRKRRAYHPARQPHTRRRCRRSRSGQAMFSEPPNSA